MKKRPPLEIREVLLQSAEDINHLMDTIRPIDMLHLRLDLRFNILALEDYPCEDVIELIDLLVNRHYLLNSFTLFVPPLQQDDAHFQTTRNTLEDERQLFEENNLESNFRPGMSLQEYFIEYVLPHLFYDEEMDALCDGLERLHEHMRIPVRVAPELDFIWGDNKPDWLSLAWDNVEDFPEPAPKAPRQEGSPRPS